MGFFDLFRGKKVEASPKVKEVSLSEARSIIEKDLEDSKEKIKELKEEIGKRIKNFVIDIGNRILVLGKIDLKDKRENERLKSLTLQGKDEYVTLLGRLVEGLEKVNNNLEINGYLNEIDLAINNFLRSSRKKLDRATILIGEDMAETEKIVKSFYKELNSLSRENNYLFSKLSGINKLNGLEDSLKGVEELFEGSNKELLKKESEEKNLEAESKDLRAKLKDYEEGEEHTQWMKKKEELDNDSLGIRKSLEDFKKKIDLKELLKKYHGTKSKWNLIKGYRDDFFNSLKDDEGLEIIEVFNLDVREELGSELKKIVERSKKINEDKKGYGSNLKLNDLQEQVKKMDQKIEEIREETENIKKKIEKFGSRREEVKEEMGEVIGGIFSSEGKYAIKNVK